MSKSQHSCFVFELGFDILHDFNSQLMFLNATVSLPAKASNYQTIPDLSNEINYFPNKVLKLGLPNGRVLSNDGDVPVVVLHLHVHYHRSIKRNKCVIFLFRYSPDCSFELVPESKSLRIFVGLFEHICIHTLTKKPNDQTTIYVYGKRDANVQKPLIPGVALKTAVIVADNHVAGEMIEPRDIRDQKSPTLTNRNVTDTRKIP